MTKVKVFTDYKGLKSELFLERDDFIIGRLAGEFRPHVPLNLDLRVAPKHARVWKRDGVWRAVDLGTLSGTFVNDERLTSVRTVEPGDVLRVGVSKLTWEELTPEPPFESPPTATIVPAAPTHAPPDAEAYSVLSSMNARENAPFYFDLTLEDAQTRLAQLMELPLLLAGATELSALCQTALNRMMELMVGAERGALLAFDPATNKLALRASHPEDNPPISRTLIKKAVADGRGFIWNQGDGTIDPTVSMRRLVIASGMYAPLIWHGEVMGVICVDNPHRVQAFQDEDLRYLMAASQYLAAALAGLVQRQKAET